MFPRFMSRNEVQSMLEKFGGKKRFVFNLLLEKSLGVMSSSVPVRLLMCQCNTTQHISAFWPKKVWNGLQKSSGVSSCFISTVSHICLSSQLTSARWCRPRRNVWSVWQRTTWREANTSWSSCGTTTIARGYSCSLHFKHSEKWLKFSLRTVTTSFKTSSRIMSRLPVNHSAL